MGLTDLFVNKKNLCENDDCIYKAIKFINTICSYDAKNLNCPLFVVNFYDDYINFFFCDTDGSAPCIYMNMFKNGVAEEDAINQLLSETLHMNDLPKETTIEWKFDNNGMYDSFVLQYRIITEHKKCQKIYHKYISKVCKEQGITFTIQGDSLHLKLI